MTLYDRIGEAADYILGQCPNFRPKTAIILGTGLGDLTDDAQKVAVIPYSDIPHFPISTVPSHKNQLVLGHIDGHAVAILAGRFHYYEGYTMQQVTFAVRVMHRLGASQLIVSNVTGSLQPHILAGDLVLIRDHINLMPDNPLRGENDDRLGPRFPDMSQAYDPLLLDLAARIAAENNIRAHRGVYAALPGPNLETPAEYRYLHTIGADIVGMSSVPEVIVARHAGMRVFAISIASNQAYPFDTIGKTTLEEVIATANEAAPKMRFVVRGLLRGA